MCDKHPTNVANSDESTLQILGESNKYLELKTDTSTKINTAIRIFRFMEDLLPQTVEKFWSGHMFPIVEANHELEDSIQLCKMGFYKHALIAMRSTLELGLLSVYWDLDDQGHVKMQKWLLSHKCTPSNKTVIAALKTNKNIKVFDDKHNFFRRHQKCTRIIQFCAY